MSPVDDKWQKLTRGSSFHGVPLELAFRERETVLVTSDLSLLTP